MVQGLGVVLSARRRCWWRPASTFVPAERIRHLVINEVRRMVAAQSPAAELATASYTEHAAA
jgi:GPI-GlcNAc transferase complex, PIG-H component